MVGFASHEDSVESGNRRMIKSTTFFMVVICETRGQCKREEVVEGVFMYRKILKHSL